MFFPGSKSLLAACVSIAVVLMTMLTALLAAKSSRLNLKERELLIVKESHEARNAEVMRKYGYEIN